MKEYKLKINGNDYAVTVTNVEDTIAEVEVNGIPFRVEIERPAKKQSVPLSRINKPAKVEANIVRQSTTGQETVITSPLPGVILEVVVKEGDSVKRGQKLLVLEAMKMENVIESSVDGKIVALKVNKGDSVLEGAPLIIIG
ncbi:MAG: acetyl-CoA carboxylase biotin carboxyl carrier protein subunit [Bacteroidetes bacterium HGW-Bacteroidetes-8]|jgi:biotin carboxyl carrier protein|nr:MAG: acetyl-CoA carboxylase biotin carboxyl carrier protein subunit [Bacteroidetes bacterium HGW-Bacteroidetes-8]